MTSRKIILVVLCIAVMNASASEEFDIGSFVDDVLTATNDEWRVSRYDVVIHVNTHDDRSLAGKPFSLHPRRGGHSKDETISGVIISGNMIRAKGLIGGLEAVSYNVMVDRRKIGSISESDSLKDEPVVMALPVAEGMPAPDFSVTDIESDKKIKLSDFRGEVVFIDFWTTWCGPCQKPMAENQKIMERNMDVWSGRARILGVSLDRSREKLESHVKDKKWTAVYHTWAGGWRGTEAADIYNVSGVPTGILIDSKGIIRWRGHPGNIDVEDRIEELLGEDS